MSSRAVSFVVMFSTVISGLLAAVVICVPVIVSAFAPYTVPPEVKEWGGIIVGFYFGSFTTFILEYMKGPRTAAPPPVPQGQGSTGNP